MALSAVLGWLAWEHAGDPLATRAPAPVPPAAAPSASVALAAANLGAGASPRPVTPSPERDQPPGSSALARLSSAELLHEALLVATAAERKEELLEELQRRRAPETALALLQLLSDASADVRTAAAESLAEADVAAADAVPALRRALARETDRRARAALRLTLDELSDDDRGADR
jgi:hypothetical protein